MSTPAGRNLFALWLHALVHRHQMASIQVNGWHSPKIRLCWQCDQTDIEKVLGHSLGESKMSTPERGRRRTDLFDERLARLRCFINHSATREIIAGSARLVLRAHDGGRVGHILAEIADLARWTWSWYVQIPFMRALCRLDIYHMEQGPGEFGCPFCWRGETMSAERIETIYECGCGCICHVCRGGHAAGSHTEACQEHVVNGAAPTTPHWPGHESNDYWDAVHAATCANDLADYLERVRPSLVSSIADLRGLGLVITRTLRPGEEKVDALDL